MKMLIPFNSPGRLNDPAASSLPGIELCPSTLCRVIWQGSQVGGVFPHLLQAERLAPQTLYVEALMSNVAISGDSL